MKNKFFSIGAVLLLYPLTTVGAIDVTGNWIAQIPNNHCVAETLLNPEVDEEKTTYPGEQSLNEVVFSFRVHGNKLTGKVITPDGETEISEGKFHGDEFSFVVNRGIGGKQIIRRYTGKISGRVYGDELELTCEVPGGIEKPYELIAKREFPLGDYDRRMRGIFKPAPKN